MPALVPTAPNVVLADRSVDQMSPAARGGLLVTGILATLIGVFSLRYVLPAVPLPLLENFVTNRTPLVVHAVSASVALLVGPWQLLPDLRRRHPGFHRQGGRIYAGSVLVAWISSIPVAIHAETGVIASARFLGLGLFWAGSTAMASGSSCSARSFGIGAG